MFSRRCRDDLSPIVFQELFIVNLLERNRLSITSKTNSTANEFPRKRTVFLSVISFFRVLVFATTIRTGKGRRKIAHKIADVI